MEIKTYEQWRELHIDFDDYVERGDLVDDEMAEYFENVVGPPTHNGTIHPYAIIGDEDYIQCGEPNEELEDVRAEEGMDYTYSTFVREGEYWRFCGYCLPGRTDEEPLWECENIYRELDGCGFGCPGIEPPPFSVCINRIMGRDICYFMVCDQLASMHHNEFGRAIRLSILGNVAYDLNGDSPLWEPSRVPFDLIKQWLREPSLEPTLTNWQYLLYQWNEINLYIVMEIDDFLSGKEDELYKEYSNKRYLPATTPMPDYNTDIRIER